MDIQAEKLEIMKLILETNNPRILESIRGLFSKSKTTDFWNSLPASQKEDILQGIDEIERGEIIDYEDFMKRHR